MTAKRRHRDELGLALAFMRRLKGWVLAFRAPSAPLGAKVHTPAPATTGGEKAPRAGRARAARRVAVGATRRPELLLGFGPRPSLEVAMPVRWPAACGMAGSSL